jgi:hypothetical protein
MQCLRATARTGLTALDLRQEEWLSQDMMRGGQHGLQAADLLHGRRECRQSIPRGAPGHMSDGSAPASKASRSRPIQAAGIAPRNNR